METVAKPRVVKAGNRGPFTLDGTRSFLIGRGKAVVIDPGPNVEEHVRALSLSLAQAREIKILLTHGHGDHSGASGVLSEALAAPVYGPPSTGHLPLVDGDIISTDEGDLVAIATPGHTRDHLAFLWPRARSLFVGDLLLGRGGTTWLGEYPGCVADYLASLERVKGLEPEVVYPAHGPPVEDPPKTIEAFRAHRMDRLAQLQEVRAGFPGATVDELLLEIYGRALPPRLGKAARSSIEVMLHHLQQIS